VRLLAAACGDQDNNRGTGPTEEEAAALAAYTAAFNAEDTDAIMALYAKPPPSEARQGQCLSEALFAAYGPSPSTLRPTAPRSATRTQQHWSGGTRLVHGRGVIHATQSPSLTTVNSSSSVNAESWERWTTRTTSSPIAARAAPPLPGQG